MREDMAKVVVERPRFGREHAKRAARSVRRKNNDARGFDDAPRRGSMTPYASRKTFNEHLGPLRRFLASRRGTPWNDVWSEICARLRSTSTTQRHVLQHVAGYVELHPRLDARGRPWTLGLGGPFPLTSGSPVNRFYVHPDTGLLLAAPPRPPRARPRAALPVDVHLDGGRVFARFGGLWFAPRMEPVPSPFGAYRLGSGEGPFDVVLRASVDKTAAAVARAAYGRADRYAADKGRQLCSRDLRHAVLINEPSPS